MRLINAIISKRRQNDYCVKFVSPKCEELATVITNKQSIVIDNAIYEYYNDVCLR